MASFLRWVFHDPYLSETWEVPINPREMSSPFAEKNVTTLGTTAIDGKVLLFEGAASPAQWTFAGRILDPDHYAQLLYWSEKKNRIRITDHFGRNIVCYLQKFEPTPKRAANHYWSHDYTMTALVLVPPTAPTYEVGA